MIIMKVNNRQSKNAKDILQSYKLHHENYEKLESGINCWRKTLAQVKIQKGIFHGDALSPLQFVIAIMPLNYIPRKCSGRYKFTNLQEKINHLMYMDDIE